MKILVIGSGGREHALVWKLSQSSSVSKLWCAPGNGGISQNAECVPVDVANPVAIADLALSLGADLTVIGPELPLVSGVADEFASRKQRIFGPNRSAGRLEGSKIFAKRFMQSHGVPTADVLGEFDDFAAASKSLSALDFPLVLKADGLCAGKGVLVAKNAAEAQEFLERALVRKEFGDGGSRILFEETLSGPELSIIVATDGETIVPMAPSRDHKRLLDGDRGPNTGGMGAFSSDDLLPPPLRNQVLETIIKPAIAGLRRDRIPYCGFLYFGLMLTPSGPIVLEFNCRSGDPETQAIVMRMDFDLAELLDACASGELNRVRNVESHWQPAASSCVVIASQGYPGEYAKGLEIRGLAETRPSSTKAVFHAGTVQKSGKYYTSGGRVLGVSATADSIKAAIASSYDMISKISFDGMQYRRDIGRALSEPAHI